MGVKFNYIEYFLPSNILSNEDLYKEFSNYEPSQIESKIDIRNRHIVTKNEAALDLAFNLYKKILKEHNKSEIDFLIKCKDV